MRILRQKEFARADYAGLNEKQAEALRAQRSKIAADLNANRNLINKDSWANGIALDNNGNSKRWRNAEFNNSLNIANKEASAARNQILSNNTLKDIGSKKLEPIIATNKSGSIIGKVSNFMNKPGMKSAALTGAGIGLAYGGYKLLGDGKKKEEKTYSVLLTEEEYKLFCELIENN